MNNAPKVKYSEHEAALMLGVTIEQLRSLVRDLIVKDDSSADPAVPSYHASDLVVLRVLARMPRPVQIVHA